MLPALHSYAFALSWVSFAPLLVKLKILLNFGEEQGGNAVLTKIALNRLDCKTILVFFKKKKIKILPHSTGVSPNPCEACL